MPNIKDIVIIGTGPAGLTAAIYAARAGLKPVVYAGLQHGGQLTITTEVENYPGFAKGIMGPQLMMDMTAQAEAFGTQIAYKMITKVEPLGNEGSNQVKVLYSDDEKIESKTVVIATGATARTLGLPEEKQLMGRGLSTCATCDGFFFKGKEVAVIGGGDSAMEEATYLAKLCSKVYLIHRRDGFKASPIMLERAKQTPNIEFLIPYNLESCLQEGGSLCGLQLIHSESGEKRSLKVDGAFYAIGHIPNSKTFAPWVDTDDHGYIDVNITTTKSPGVFAAGDIADPLFKQAITAAGMGCQAAIQAQHYLDNWQG